MRRTFTIALALLALWTAPAHPADDEDDIEIGKKKVSEWVRILENKDATLKQRQAALIVMGIADPRRPGVVAALVTALRRDADADIRKGAAQTLGQIFSIPDKDKRLPVETTADSLGTSVKTDESAAVRAAAANALGRMGPAAKIAVPALLAALKDKEPGPRAAAAQAVGLVQAEPEDAMPLLVDALNDSDRNVRLAVMAGLAQYGPKAQRAAAGLGNLIAKDESPDVRKKAAETLSLIGPDGKAAAAALVDALQKDKDVDVRRWASIALAKMAGEAKDSVPNLAATLATVLEKEPDRFVRGHAAHALGKLGKDGVAPLQKCAANDIVVEVRLAAIEELGEIGPAANQDTVVKMLTAFLRDGRPTVREAAETALKKIQKQ
jgi:HEAT repeat protein